MHSARTVPLCIALWLLTSACGGSKGGGSSGPPVLPNDAPTMQVPTGLTGTVPRYTFALATTSRRTLTFTATDVNGDPLLWQLSVSSGEATATGLGFSSPVVGNTFTLEVTAVTAPAAAAVTVLVEDPRGAAAAIDLLIVRSGAPTVSGVTPSSAFVNQPQGLTVSGAAMLLGGAINTTVRVGGQSATEVVVANDTRLTCTTPTGTTAGPTVVSIANAYGTSALPGSLFRLFPFPPSFATADQRLDTLGAAEPQLAIEGTSAHAVWIESGMVMHRSSADGGTTWTPAQSVSGVELATEPQVLVAGMDLTVVWIGNGNAVWLRRSADGGLTFLVAQRLDAATPVTAAARPRLCQTGGRRYAAWVAGNPGVGAARIVSTLSGDRGANWTTATAVADGSANQGNHSIACNDLLVWLTFDDERDGALARGVYVVRSANGGATFEPALRLSQTGSIGSEPRLCVDATQVHVAWLRAGSLYYNASANNGVTWGNSVTLLRDTTPGTLTSPSICCAGSRVVATYIAAGNAVWATRLEGLGGLAVHTRLDAGTTEAAQPRVACSGRYVFAAWRKGAVGDGSARIQQTTSVDSGQTFLTAAGLGDGTAAQKEPQLVKDGARVMLGWLDNRGVAVGLFVNPIQQ
ncbi:MAG: sialidase family protein [Planctomycetota bacterium]